MTDFNFADLAQALFEEAGDALFLFDPDDDRLLDVNATALRLSGFTRPDLLRIPVTSLYRFEGTGGRARMRHASQETGIFHGQDGFLLRTRADDVWIPVNLTITRLHVKPKTLALITARDVREQREAHRRVKAMEAELRRVMASVSDCLWSAEIDAKGCWTYTYLSPVVEKIAGRPPDFFLGGLRHWWGVVHPEDRPRCEKALVRLRSGQPNQEEYRILWPDGSHRWVRDSVLPSRGDPAPALRLDGVLTDITERKKAEEALRQAVASERQAHQELKETQTRLIQSEKLAGLGQLVAGVAHEINNPLAFVGNNLAVLQRDAAALRDLLRLYREGEAALGERRPDLLARIAAFAEAIDLAYTLDNLEGLVVRSRDGMQRIQAIVKGLRDFARLDESELKEVDLNDGIRSTLDILRGEARKKHVRLTLDLAPLPEVTCYPARVNQVVMNLVANAIQAAPSEGEVTVRTSPRSDGVAIEVRDNGPGIDPAIRAKIFDPFFTTKPPGQGTGLGLSISYQVVRDHGGRIEVESLAGEGAHFTVYLPLKAPPPEAQHA
jgi:PAS domain S-box-containing protein